MSRPRIPRHGLMRRKAHGFTLLEVMIALLVLAFGLLGFGLLQTMNLRFTQSANYRTQATNLAYDLLDQIRANRLLASQYAAIDAGSFGGITGEESCTSVVGAMTVEASIKRWKCQVVGTLGAGANAIVTYKAADGTVNVKITWGDQRWSEVLADRNRTFEVETRL